MGTSFGTYGLAFAKGPRRTLQTERCGIATRRGRHQGSDEKCVVSGSSGRIVEDFVVIERSTGATVENEDAQRLVERTVALSNGGLDGSTNRRAEPHVTVDDIEEGRSVRSVIAGASITE